MWAKWGWKAVNSTVCSPFSPNERGLPARDPVAPVGEVPIGARIGAFATPVDAAHPERLKLPACQHLKIRHELARLLRLEGIAGAAISPQERLPYLGAHFEILSADGRAQPCDQAFRGHRQGTHR